MLIGSGAWVLGVLVATGGSLYVSHQLGQSIFSAGPVLTSGQVQTRLSGEASEGAPSASRSPFPSSARSSGSSSPSPSAAGSPSTSRSPSPSQGGGGHSSPAPGNSSSPPQGKLFQTQAGSIYADCAAGGAYIQYWTPQNGYDSEQVIQGPARIASVTFRAIDGGGGDYGNNSGVQMNVTCPNGPGSMPVENTQGVGHGGD